MNYDDVVSWILGTDDVDRSLIAENLKNIFTTRVTETTEIETMNKGCE